MTFDQFLKAIMTIGIPTILLCFIYIGRKLECLENLKNDSSSIKDDIKGIFTKLGCHSEDIASLKTSVGIAGSPMHPNEKGKDILERSKFSDVYKLIKEELFKQLDEKGTHTLYDTEINTQTLLMEMSNKKEFNPIKSFLVNNPTELSGQLSLELVFMIASWIIRDDYAKERNIKE